ncbi:MAG: carboxylating nicotinate-nucleotide diphosphorylase [Pseudomonadota bacterium]|jgi:nicotinate-nucleotide pyrophosphorylase (carboxylating)|nr:carboxylating nicotinate-nucleotide diphosphorylase [Pseudomonadota bacterium]
MSEPTPAGPALLPPADLDAQVSAALREDVGRGDVTAALVPPEQRVRGQIVSREAAILCGQPWVEACFRQLDPQIRLTWHLPEGAALAPGARVCTVEGAARGVLTGERTALNFLQLLSGTATAAHRFAQAVAGTGCTVLDTRKTLPGLRNAQKYAVRCGGAANHRMGLYDMVLIKENHILAAGSIGAAVGAARRLAAGVRIEVEVESLEELEQAFAAAPDIVMLDEFSLEDMREAVARNRARGRPVQLEASGSVSLESIAEVAATGVDFISVGALTKHVRAVDLSMRLEFQTR